MRGRLSKEQRRPNGDKDKGRYPKVQEIGHLRVYVRFVEIHSLQELLTDIIMCISLSDRKRMSVIVEDAAGDIWLYCKGADTTVYPLIVAGKVEESKAHVDDFSMVRMSVCKIKGYRNISCHFDSREV